MSAFDVCVVGNAGIDTNIYLHTPEIDFSVEANFTDNRDYVGQAGGYASRGYAQLGYRTAFIGAVGDDPWGRYLLDEFARAGIDTTAVFHDPAGTARSVNLMYPDGRRKNFYDGKSHMTLQPDLALCEAVLGRARLEHFNIPNWARWLLPLARRAGVTIACDLQDMQSLDDPYRQDFILAADVLFFSSANHPDPAPAIQALLARRPELIIVVGMGVRGCALGTRDGLRFFEPAHLPLPVIDTNGAGDALAVGFLSSYYFENYSLEESIRRGQLAARYTCSLKASSSNLITKRLLDQYFSG